VRRFRKLFDIALAGQEHGMQWPQQSISEQLFATIDAFRGRADQFGRAFLDLPTRFGSQCLAFFEQRFEGLGTGPGGQGIGAKAKKPELAHRFLGAANPLRVATLINQGSSVSCSFCFSFIQLELKVSATARAADEIQSSDDH
jgi:hypothetical protein